MAAKAAASLAASFPSRTPVSGPQRHCPRSTTGAREGEPQGESMPFPRPRSLWPHRAVLVKLSSAVG